MQIGSSLYLVSAREPTRKQNPDPTWSKTLHPQVSKGSRLCVVWGTRPLWSPRLDNRSRDSISYVLLSSWPLRPQMPKVTSSVLSCRTKAAFLFLLGTLPIYAKSSASFIPNGGRHHLQVRSRFWQSFYFDSARLRNMRCRNPQSPCEAAHSSISISFLTKFYNNPYQLCVLKKFLGSILNMSLSYIISWMIYLW